MGGCIVYTGLKLLLLIRPFISSFFLSPIFKLNFLIALFLGTVRTTKLKLGTHVWTVGGCIMFTGIKLLLLLIRPFICSFFFPIFKIKFFRHTFLVNCEDYKVETWYTQGQWVDVSCITQLGSYCLFLPLFLQFSFQFSNIKMFRHTFIRNYDAYKLKTWYRHGQSCILDSFCYFVFVPLFIFISCQFSNIKIFITFFSWSVWPITLKLGTHMDNGWMYHVY